MASETILVVDDSSDILNVIENNFLVPVGYRVLTALDGREGLQKAIESSPDLILLDMNMPFMNGLEMLAALRQKEHHFPVIFMTALGSEQVAVEAFRLGVRDYLNKPFSAQELLSAIDRSLREKRLSREREELNRNLITAETVRVTVVTLSHYLNNYLTSLNGSLDLLEENLGQADAEMLSMLKDGKISAASIQAVIRVLVKTTGLRLTSYTHSTPMIDIEAALQEELAELKRGRMG